MLKMILDKHVLFVLMGIFTVLGVVSKCIVTVTLNRLVRAAGNMNKTTHPFIRLVRAKFEHACMISDKVENVGVFVDKYLYEYKVAGFRLHSLRRMEKAASGLCLLIGALGAFLEYWIHGMGDAVLRTGAVGGILAVLIYLFHLTTDEDYRIEAAKNYMVDYLENVCLHKYEKAAQKELKVTAQDTPAAEFGVMPEEEEFPEESRLWDASRFQTETRSQEKQGTQKEQKTPQEIPVPDRTPQIQTPEPSRQQEMPDVVPPIQAARTEEIQRKEQKNTKRQEESSARPEPARDVLIRQILEEFMA